MADKPKSTPTERRRSRLAREADAAARALLLAELERLDWSITAVADSLEMNGPSNVIRAVRQLGLTDEYEAARVAGKVKSGPRPSRE